LERLGPLGVLEPAVRAADAVLALRDGVGLSPVGGRETERERAGAGLSAVAGRETDRERPGESRVGNVLVRTGAARSGAAGMLRDREGSGRSAARSRLVLVLLEILFPFVLCSYLRAAAASRRSLKPGSQYISYQFKYRGSRVLYL
jgi:hypothetical protein